MNTILRHIVCLFVIFIEGMPIASSQYKVGDLYYEIIDNSTNAAVIPNPSPSIPSGPAIIPPRVYDIVIPEKVQLGELLCTVVELKDKAFYDLTTSPNQLRSVVIPATVKKIGKNLFGTKNSSTMSFMGELENFDFLKTIGLASGSTINMLASDIRRMEIEDPNIHLLQYRFYPSDLLPYYSFTNLQKDNNELYFSLEKEEDDAPGITVIHNGQTVVPSEYGTYHITGADCYPENTVELEFQIGDIIVKKLLFYIPLVYPIHVSVDEYKKQQCSVIIGVTAAHPEDVNGFSETGIRINRKGQTDYHEYVAPMVDYDLDVSEFLISGLLPGTEYEAVGYGISDGHKIYDRNMVTFRTNSLLCTISDISAGARHIDAAITLHTDGSGDPDEFGAVVRSSKYGNRLFKANERGLAKITNLNPAAYTTIEAYVRYGKDIIILNSSKYICTVVDYKFYIENPVPPTSANIRVWVENEVEAQKVELTVDRTSIENDHVIMTGLKPRAEHTLEAKVWYKCSYSGQDKFFTLKGTFTTAELEMTALPARAASNTCAVLAAETNVSELESGCGFEWRRYDAPPEMPSTFSPCYVANGMLAGKLKNLSANTYYKYRPYYKDSTGEIYYSNDGAWLAFITADAYVYFEPIVYTYEPVSIGESSAVLRGYVLAGSDDIIEQGFQYWEASSDESRPRKIVSRVPEGDVSTILASGQVMQASLSELRPSTEYRFRAFVRSASGENYGTEESFTTKGISSIEDIVEINPDHLSRAIIGYWDIRGCRHETPIIGLNIIKYSDGAVEKVFMTE